MNRLHGQIISQIQQLDIILTGFDVKLQEDLLETHLGRYKLILLMDQINQHKAGCNNCNKPLAMTWAVSDILEQTPESKRKLLCLYCYIDDFNHYHRDSEAQLYLNLKYNQVNKTKPITIQVVDPFQAEIRASFRARHAQEILALESLDELQEFVKEIFSPTDDELPELKSALDVETIRRRNRENSAASAKPVEEKPSQLGLDDFF